MLGGFTRARFRGDDSFFLHWDDDEGTLRNVQLEVWIAAVDDEENVTLLDSVEATSVRARRAQPSSYCAMFLRLSTPSRTPETFGERNITIKHHQVKIQNNSMYVLKLLLSLVIPNRTLDKRSHFFLFKALW